MSLKILGGVARGFLLAAPKTADTRPTSVLIRRKIFDWRQNLAGHQFIDLCAGSGAMGFEALSRGADEVYFIESARLAIKTIHENKERFQKSFAQTGQINVFAMDAVKWLSQYIGGDLGQNESTIIFVDPPYKDHQLYMQVLELLKQKQFKGEIWMEADRLDGPEQKLLSDFLELTKTVEQGDHFVLIGKIV